MYDPAAGYTIYDQDEWWKDNWDPLSYGREVDFSRPFFQQLDELRRVVPRMSLNSISNENSYYSNYSFRNKNSYLVSTADYNEDSLYGRFSDRNYRCVDFDFTFDSRFCFQVINIHKSERCFFSSMLDSCSEQFFCYDMRNCHNCIFSTGQRNQSYLIYNKKVTPDEYKAFLEQLNLKTREGVAHAWEIAKTVWEKQPRKYLTVTNCENSVGDYLKNTKNAQYCFDSYNLQDVKYSSHLNDANDIYDWDFIGSHSELCYEMVSSADDIINCRFSMNMWQGNVNCTYSDLCLGNENLFGCIGLRKKKYCILNMQYTKEEYEHLVPQIIEHMRRMGEFGEFLPVQMSPFAYNDSVAYEYFPLTKEETLVRGWKWRDEEPRLFEPVNDAISCATCKKNFKLVESEMKFYQDMGVPHPIHCWLCRHRERRALKNPRRIYRRPCTKCGDQMFSTYAPERPEPVYCEKCYLQEVAG